MRAIQGVRPASWLAGWFARWFAITAAITAAIGPGVRVARADPATPQIAPARQQREDAQRLRDLQRDLERTHLVMGSPATPKPARRADDGGTGRTAGVVLLTLGGLAAVVAIPVAMSSTTADKNPDGSASGNGGLATGLFISAAVAGIAGAALLVSNPKPGVAIAPTATPTSIGLAVTGTL